MIAVCMRCKFWAEKKQVIGYDAETQPVAVTRGTCFVSPKKEDREKNDPACSLFVLEPGRGKMSATGIGELPGPTRAGGPEHCGDG